MRFVIILALSLILSIFFYITSTLCLYLDILSFKFMFFNSKILDKELFLSINYFISIFYFLSLFISLIKFNKISYFLIFLNLFFFFQSLIISLLKLKTSLNQPDLLFFNLLFSILISFILSYYSFLKVKQYINILVRRWIK